MLGLTRAAHRDRIRRMLSITPLYDITGNVSDIGEPVPNMMNPTNAQINDALSICLQEISITCQFAANLQSSIVVMASTTPGPLYIDLQTSIGNFQQLNQIRRCVWQATGTQTVVPLIPTNREDLDRESILFDNYSPGTPSYFWVESYNLGLLPSPSTSGTLNIIAGLSPIGFISDLDVILQLPADNQIALDYGALCILCRSNPKDEESAVLLQVYQPMYAAAITAIKNWQNSLVSPESQGSVSYQSNRRGQGLQKIRH